MSKDYTQYDWASDRLARMTWEDEERRIDRRMKKYNHKNRRRQQW